MFWDTLSKPVTMTSRSFRQRSFRLAGSSPVRKLDKKDESIGMKHDSYEIILTHLGAL